MRELKPRPHAEIIKAWADGATIQFKSKGSGVWTTTSSPLWHINTEYRIKPEPTDIEKYGVEVGDVWITHSRMETIAAKCGDVGVRYTNSAGTSILQSSARLVFRRGVVNDL